MKTRIAAILAIGLLALSALGAYAAPAAPQQISLEGQWKFNIDPMNAGLRKGWYAPGFDTSKWRLVRAPGKWESQGVTQFNPNWKGSQQTEPYDGYAWYRRSVVIPAAWKGKKIYLNLGRIDDVDWTYVNGAMVGNTGSVAQIAPGELRQYEIPPELVRFGKPNVIAVRALDEVLDGGIMTGPLSLSLTPPPSESAQSAGTETEVRPGPVNVGSDVVIKEGERVYDAVAVGGDLDISGEVLQDATAIGGDVILRPTGHVHGSVTSVGGSVVRSPGSQIDGGVVSTVFPGLSHLPFNHGHGNDLGGYIWGLMGFIVSLLFVIIAVVIAALIPNRIDMIASTVLTRPGWSAIYGVVAGLLIVPIGLFVLFTLIGIPLVPLWGIIVVVASVVGRTGATVALGRKLGDAFGRPIASVALAALIGGLAWSIVRLVPFVGVALLLILSMLGFGATWITMFGSHPDWFANRTRRSGAAAAGSAPQPPEGAPPSG